MFKVYGNHGKLTVSDSGTVISLDTTDAEESDAYKDIVKFDVDEFAAWAGKPPAGEIDILLIDFWSETGQLFKAVPDIRERNKPL